MSFGAPGFLLLLALAVLALAAFALWIVWQAMARRRFGAVSRPSFAVRASAALIIASMMVAAIAAARPRFGHEETAVEQKGIDLVIVVDVSNSMFATDVAPTRLRRAQDEIGVMLERMTGDRAGLVIFAGDPFLRSPLTLDLVVLKTIIDGVHEERGLMPPGSDLGAAIERARIALGSGTADTKVMLLVSDGEDRSGSVSQAISRAAADGIRVYTAGVGTAAGSPVLDIDPETKAANPRIGADGTPVLTRLDADALAQMAATGGGRYVSIEGGGLAPLPAEFDGLASTTFASEETATPIERFQIFAAIALALAVVAMCISSVRWPRTRGAVRLWPLAGAGLFIAGICAADAADANRRGNRQYAAGEYAASVDAYRTAQALDPARSELYHNAGNAFDQLSEYATAIDETKRALAGEGDDDALRSAFEYALGAHYASASQLQDAIEAYKRSLLANPDDVDTKHNLELVTRRLTPTATSSPALTPPAPEVTPSPGDPTEPEGTPQPQGTPAANASPGPGDESDIPPEQLQRLLEEALAGIDEEFSIEEAIRVLELIEQQNRDQLDERSAAPGSLPDY